MRNRREAAAMIEAEYEHDFSHARTVADLADALFDLCAELHSLGPAEKELLALAALLHDIGWCGGRRGHHKRAYRLVLKSPPPGLTSREAAIVANVARYHRRALPKLSHDGFAALSEPDREIVRRLSALLRIADGLDFSHQGRVEVESATCGPQEVEIRCRGNCACEMKAAEKKSDLFTEVLGRGVSFKQLDRGQ